MDYDDLQKPGVIPELREMQRKCKIRPDVHYRLLNRFYNMFVYGYEHGERQFAKEVMKRIKQMNTTPAERDKTLAGILIRPCKQSDEDSTKYMLNLYKNLTALGVSPFFVKSIFRKYYPNIVVKEKYGQSGNAIVEVDRRTVLMEYSGNPLDKISATEGEALLGNVVVNF